MGDKGVEIQCQKRAMVARFVVINSKTEEKAGMDLLHGPNGHWLLVSMEMLERCCSTQASNTLSLDKNMYK